jgi:hypothetical protein
MSQIKSEMITTMKIRMPQFSADASLYSTKLSGRNSADYFIEDTHVHPALQPVGCRYLKLRCTDDDECAALDTYCLEVGGGMASEPGGGGACYIWFCRFR